MGDLRPDPEVLAGHQGGAAQVRGGVGRPQGGGRAARAGPQMEASVATIAPTEEVWSERDASPSAIDGALRRMLAERHAEDPDFVPARVLNLIAIVERDWRGEVENRLERVGRFHPSRTIVCAVEKRREAIDAVVSMGAEDHKEGEIAVGAERVELTLGEEHLERLDTFVDPLIVPDLVTLVWAPHGHDEAVGAPIRPPRARPSDTAPPPPPPPPPERAPGRHHRRPRL